MDSIIYIVGMVVTALIILLSLKFKNKVLRYISLIPFSIFLLSWLFKIYIEKGLDGFTILAAIIIIFLVILLSKKFKDRLVKYIPAMTFFIAALFFIIKAFTINSWDGLVYYVYFLAFGLAFLLALAVAVIIDIIIQFDKKHIKKSDNKR